MFCLEMDLVMVMDLPAMQVVMPFHPLLKQITSYLSFPDPDYQFVDEPGSIACVIVKTDCGPIASVYIGGYTKSIEESCEVAARKKEELERIERDYPKICMYDDIPFGLENNHKKIVVDFVVILRAIFRTVDIKCTPIETIEHSPVRYTSWFTVTPHREGIGFRCLFSDYCRTAALAKQNLARKAVDYLSDVFNLVIIDANYKVTTASFDAILCTLERESYTGIKERVLGIQEQLEPPTVLIEQDCLTPLGQEFQVPVSIPPLLPPKKRLLRHIYAEKSLVLDSNCEMVSMFPVPQDLEGCLKRAKSALIDRLIWEPSSSKGYRTKRLKSLESASQDELQRLQPEPITKPAKIPKTRHPVTRILDAAVVFKEYFAKGTTIICLNQVWWVHSKLVMEPQRKFLDELDASSKSYKVKVNIVEKGRKQESEKKILYQYIILQDDKKNRMKMTLFGDQIDAYKDVILFRGNYEIAKALIRPLDAQYRARETDLPFQMTIGSRSLIQCLDPEGEQVFPIYQSLASIPKVSLDDSRHGRQCEALVSDADNFKVVGITALRPITRKGEKAAALTEWARKHRVSLSDHQNRVTAAWNPPAERTLTTIGRIKTKKATTTLPQEVYWLRVVASDIQYDRLRTYIGCSYCGKRTQHPLGTVYTCIACDRKEIFATHRATITLTFSYGTGALQLTAFTENCTPLFGLSAEQIYHMKATISDSRSILPVNNPKYSFISFKF
uniref:Uncharacterized protein n=1 Tax=Chenopodium quinoa TaxID=63459 RepID=A0A803MJ67_CHEQI